MGDEDRARALVKEALDAPVNHQLRIAAGLLEAEGVGFERLALQIVRVAYERLQVRELFRDPATKGREEKG